MPTITLNNEPLVITDHCSLKKVLRQLQYSSGFYATAVNNTFIPHHQHAQLILHEGDRVEVLTPMVGG